MCLENIVGACLGLFCGRAFFLIPLGQPAWDSGVCRACLCAIRFAQAYYQEVDDEQGETFRVGESPESLSHCEIPSAAAIATASTNPLTVPPRFVAASQKR